ncbi:putative cis-zeatin O-glucosyltransferase [Dichanthelium oligosanthes]|uniref:Putative cis-zeatin O-glucosyltransferase n=1 Tax=Dichanthelium oligosanthes TaxID=888268 RepID=A0A1E5W5G0_9POAL|nr:putative cis-zeatin O-glucosyltransferase [Dichanthelium oligosanthes]
MESPVAVVAVPFPAQGHLNALLHLSLQLAARGLPVHYAAPAEHAAQARARVHGWGDDALRRLEFHDLPIPAYASPPPDDTGSTSFPAHLMPLWEAFTAGAPAPLATLLAAVSASHRRVVVLYDIANAFAAEEAARLPNGEGFGLVCTCLSTFVGRTDAGSHLLRERGIDYVPIYTYMSEEFFEYVTKRARSAQTIPSSAGVLANTCRALEGEFIDLFAEQLAAAGKKFFSIGPLNPLLDASSTEQRGKKRHECQGWLDKQPPASVLYVSFGSTSSLRGEQVTELAAALRDSKQRFIWVLRDADRGNIFTDGGENRHAELLSEFAEQTEGRGLVITGWAPQLEILAHGATAAFLSHCGWNSTIESMSHGKPILAWPIHSDQPLNAELVCKYLKAGILDS